MDIRQSAKTETRTLGKYVKAKLGISLKDFCAAESVHPRTLYDRWETTEGKVKVMDTVFRFYVAKFDDL
jgi:hypothetical protein